MHSRATDRRSASKCQENGQIRPLEQAFGLPEVLVAVSTSDLSCKRAGKTRTLMAVWDSSGESRFNEQNDLIGNSVQQLHCIRSDSLPRLAWCAVLGKNDDKAIIHHGVCVEVGGFVLLCGRRLEWTLLRDGLPPRNYLHGIRGAFHTRRHT